APGSVFGGVLVVISRGGDDRRGNDGCENRVRRRAHRGGRLDRKRGRADVVEGRDRANGECRGGKHEEQRVAHGQDSWSGSTSWRSRASSPGKDAASARSVPRAAGHCARTRSTNGATSRRCAPWR